MCKKRKKVIIKMCKSIKKSFGFCANICYYIGEMPEYVLQCQIIDKIEKY